ncbi:hypothetical protein [Flagellimonas sp.]|uniref:hypothetical protein n=1 Tax=Flagellimonas sp. TaxID=2058762 RepID=UPI003BB0E7DE
MADVYNKPKKKKTLNPKRPIKPESEIPSRFFRINLSVGRSLHPKIINVRTPKKKRQNPASIKWLPSILFVQDGNLTLKQKWQ